MTAPRFPTVAVAGVGLIGGSFVAALRQAGQVGRVLGMGRNPLSLEKAQSLGLIDAIATPQEAASADLIMLAAPVGATGPLLGALAPHLGSKTIITDAGSTKADVVASARAALGKRIGQFVPGHPIAGAERTGPDAAQAALYQDRTVILTPLAENTVADVRAVRDAWTYCGAYVIDMDADAHDQALAAVSHLPHLLASVFMAHIVRSPDAVRRMALAGSGFRDFTRIAAGSPEMWRDIFQSNRSAMLTEIAALRDVLDESERALRAHDTAALQSLLQTAADARRQWEKERRA
ncbi:prephenate dehydrogenase/arogenate dehydrogenase family protein [Alcaligenaceae bacterium A4P071]|nr:prephenate dehydrogenase/arogenate dehydrogenase family protein [Alcaligenaceae bacterium A4P071]